MKKSPSSIEEVDQHVQDLKAPWPMGLIVERLDKDDPNPYYKLKLEPQPNSSRRTEFGGPDFVFSQKKGIRVTATQRPWLQATHWLVLDSHWDPDHCYLWIEIVSLGERQERGWLRDPESKLRKAEL
jgi:hypothetical protein